ncbi:MAG: TrkA C-terminal domain-containing protein, partial [Acidimicrobiales bacterium]
SVVPSLTTNLGFATALEALSQGSLGWVPVVDDQSTVVGVVSSQDLVQGYRIALERSLEPGLVAHRTSGTDPMAIEEIAVEEGSVAAGKTIRQLTLPPGTLVITLQRADTFLLPTADTTVAPGDRLGLVAHPAQVVALRRIFSTSTEQSKVDVGQGLSAGGLI